MGICGHVSPTKNCATKISIFVVVSVSCIGRVKLFSWKNVHAIMEFIIMCFIPLFAFKAFLKQHGVRVFQAVSRGVNMCLEVLPRTEQDKVHYTEFLLL